MNSDEELSLDIEKDLEDAAREEAEEGALLRSTTEKLHNMDVTEQNPTPKLHPTTSQEEAQEVQRPLEEVPK